MNRVVVVGRRADQAVAASTFLGAPGVATVGCAGEPVRAADVSVDTVANADVLLANLDVSPEVVRTALYHARGKVILDPAPDDPATGIEDADSLRLWVNTFAPFIHVLVPDPPAVSLLTRTPNFPIDLDELFSQTCDLAERLRISVAVPLGASGALIAAQGADPELVEAPPVDVVDIAGADDCFRGVLAVLLAEKMPLTEAVPIAVQAAAFSSTAPGPRGALPTRADVTALSTT